MSSDTPEIKKYSRWQEKYGRDDLVMIEYTMSGEVYFRDIDDAAYGTRGHMPKEDFLKKYKCVKGDPEKMEKYSEWVEIDAYRDVVEIKYAEYDEVTFIDVNASDHGVETVMTVHDFLEKFEEIK